MLRQPTIAVLGVASISFTCAPALAGGPEPRSVDALVASAATLTAEEMSSIARRFEAPEYLVVGGHVGGITLVGGKGDLLRIGDGFGQTIQPEQSAKRGIFWNHADEPVFIRVGSETELTAVPSGTFVVVGDIIIDNPVIAARPRNPGESPIALGVSVTCGSGYYACCTGSGGSSNKARCRQNHLSDADCTAGGVGSVSCTIAEP